MLKISIFYNSLSLQRASVKRSIPTDMSLSGESPPASSVPHPAVKQFSARTGSYKGLKTSSRKISGSNPLGLSLEIQFLIPLSKGFGSIYDQNIFSLFLLFWLTTSGARTIYLPILCLNNCAHFFATKTFPKIVVFRGYSG